VIRWLARAVVLTAGVCVCALSQAEPPPSVVRCERSYSLQRGVAAPCSGLLVPGEEAIQAATCLHVDLPQCERRREDEQRQARLQIETMSGLIDRAEIAQRKTAELLRQALALQRAGPPWYEEPAFVAPVSAIGAIAGVLLVLWGVGAI
jgi:hypothetical protein